MRLSLNLLFCGICALFVSACNSRPEQSTHSRQRPAEDTSSTTVAAAQPPEAAEKVIMFYGNSLTAGYGLDPSESFPSLIQQKLDSLGYTNYKVVNAGLSGETTAGGNQRLDWVLERQKVDIFVLELGANDGLRGVNTESTRKNLEEMIDKVRKAYPDAKIVLAGMMVPPNMGGDYGSRFGRIFPEVAEKKDVMLLPFLLQDVAGVRELNLGDGIHPNARGQKLLARNVWEVLEDLLEQPRRG